MGVLRIVLLVFVSVISAGAAEARGTIRLSAGQTVRVPRGFSLTRTFLFGTLSEGKQLTVLKQSGRGKTYRLTEPGTYRMTHDASQARFGFRGKGFYGDKIIVKVAEPEIKVGK